MFYKQPMGEGVGETDNTPSEWRGKEVKTCNNKRTMNMDNTDLLVVNRIKEVVGNS